jgi:hypothetical protein
MPSIGFLASLIFKSSLSSFLAWKDARDRSPHKG